MPDLWDRSTAQARKLGLTPGELSILLQNRPAPALRVIIGGRKW